MSPFPDPDAPDLLQQLGVVVPDDASALDDDVRRMERERLARHPSGLPVRPSSARAWVSGLTGGVPGKASVVAVVMAVALLAAIGMLSAAVTFLTPRVGPTSAGALPLATVPPAGTDGAGAGAAGLEGAVGPVLLPEGTVRRDGHTLPARDLRPAALVVADDPQCDGCAAALAEVAESSRRFAIPVSYVVPAEQAGPGSVVARDAAGGDAAVVTDEDGVLGAGRPARAGTSGPKLVLVHADGVVAYAGPVEDGATLKQRLSPLTDPGVEPAPAAETDADAGADAGDGGTVVGPPGSESGAEGP